MQTFQDLYHDPRVLEPDPSLTAIACIQLALETFGIQVQSPLNTDFPPVLQSCFIVKEPFKIVADHVCDRTEYIMFVMKFITFTMEFIGVNHAYDGIYN